MAQAVLHRAPDRIGRALPSGSPPDFFPLNWWCRSKPGRVSCRYRAGAPAIWYARCARAGSWPPSAAAHLWRWLHQDAIRPWFHRSWIFPRDPDFAEKAGRLLDLYAREWQGRALKDDEFVISADEKTSIQARRRKHATQACRP